MVKKLEMPGTPFGTTNGMSIKDNPEGKSVRFRLAFPRRSLPIEFEMPAPLAMSLMRLLQAYHSRHGWTVPKLKPSSVKP